MFELIFFIFIGVMIYKKVQRAKEEGGGSMKGNNSLPNTTVTTKNPREALGIPENADLKEVARSLNKSTKSGQTLFGNINPNYTGQTAIQEAKEDGNSTTAYLMEKAEADAREHAREKFEEQKRLNETRGGLAVAERYLDGDSIPQGKKCINCGYCGAENLVPMMPRTKYSCYFCREPL